MQKRAPNDVQTLGSSYYSQVTSAGAPSTATFNHVCSFLLFKYTSPTKTGHINRDQQKEQQPSAFLLNLTFNSTHLIDSFTLQ
jgi:hypothetical protein